MIINLDEYFESYREIIEESTSAVYTVKKGDTLSSIANLYKKYNITVDKIAKINNISDINNIKVGQKLNILDTNISNNTEINKELPKETSEIKNLLNNLSESDRKKVLFIARVLYSETGTKTTEEEIKKVATVIYNRAKTPQAFPYAKDIFSAVNNKVQFSCINDPKNSNWREFKPDLNERTKNAVKIAYQLYTNKFVPIDKNKKFADKYYMYIDHSRKQEPEDFYSKKYWNLIYLPETEHFKFYSLSPKKA